jgi:hypothetical protein
MRYVAPARLLPSTTLRALVRLAAAGEVLGAWLRPGRRPIRILTASGGLLASGDLGFLLRRCARIVVRYGGIPMAVEAERLIAWRALQVVTGTSHLPQLRELRAWYPALRVDGDRIVLPVGLDGGEAALAACAAVRLPVTASSIVYAVPPVR